MTRAKPSPKLAVIGGSGVYRIPGLKNGREYKLKTPFGAPSDALLIGSLAGVPCAFLPRHGRDHSITPTEINSRANIWALKSLGVERVIALAAVGSLREEIKPRDFVFPDQLIDLTRHRPTTFFGGGIVAHVSFAHPFCGELSEVLYGQCRPLAIPAHKGGVYVCMEGPQFSTKAESSLNRASGGSVIGMTAAPEAKLAREAGLCYVSVSMATDYDCWKESDEVSLEMILGNLSANNTAAQALLGNALPLLATQSRGCDCSRALESAVVTSASSASKTALKRLSLILPHDYRKN